MPYLPKGIRIKPATIFESKKGMFSSEIVKGVCNTNFILVDGYLFVIGLLKNSTQ